MQTFIVAIDYQVRAQVSLKLQEKVFLNLDLFLNKIGLKLISFIYASKKISKYMMDSLIFIFLSKMMIGRERTIDFECIGP